MCFRPPKPRRKIETENCNKWEATEACTIDQSAGSNRENGWVGAELLIPPARAASSDRWRQGVPPDGQRGRRIPPGGRGEAPPCADMGCRTAIQPWRRGDGVEWQRCQVICQRQLGAPCEGPCRCHGSTGKIAGRPWLPPQQRGMGHHRRVPWRMARYARSAAT